MKHFSRPQKLFSGSVCNFYALNGLQVFFAGYCPTLFVACVLCVVVVVVVVVVVIIVVM